MMLSPAELGRILRESKPLQDRLSRHGISRKHLVLNGIGYFQTSHWGNIFHYGKNFLEGFAPKVLGDFSVRLWPARYESPVAISLLHKSHDGKEMKIFSAKLGFDSDSVVVECLQGISLPDEKSPLAVSVPKRLVGKHGGTREFDVPRDRRLEEFREANGISVPNYLLQVLEQTARDQGYSFVKIRRPETLFWYRNYISKPAFADKLDHIRRLYYGVAAAEGYGKRGGYLVKNLLHSGKA